MSLFGGGIRPPTSSPQSINEGIHPKYPSDVVEKVEAASNELLAVAKLFNWYTNFSPHFLH
jgi:hypothetical protein